MQFAILCIILIVGYVGYQFSPIPQCLRTAEILDDVSARTVLSVGWGLGDKIGCVLASEEQRSVWQASAESLRFNALQVGQLLRR